MNDILYQGFPADGQPRRNRPSGAVPDPSATVDCQPDRLSVPLDVGMIALTGTTDADHMRADLRVRFYLEREGSS